MTNYRLPFDDPASAGQGQPEPVESRIDARDRAGRERAVDPRFNVALEASAGTGKTRILVNRYVNLLKAGVDPGEILALTFTRKAAAEMRERIVATLRDAAARGEFPRERWRQLRDRTADVTISTIDAFCLSLLREFPLEAGLDPGFSLADETEVPRLVSESLDRALRICRSLATDDEHVALVFAQLGDRRARAGLAVLLDRRIAAPAVLSRFLSAGPRDLTLHAAARRGAAALMDVFAGMRGGLDRFLETGPLEPPFLILRRQLRALETPVESDEALDPAGGRARAERYGAQVHAAFSRAREHFLTQDGQPRTKMLLYKKEDFASATDWQVHRDLVFTHAPAIVDAYAAYRRDLNVLVSRGVWRMFKVAEAEYRRTLDAHAVLDFPDLLLHARELLGQMEEFAQSRYRLESRYHHVLVDEFQDTSRAQWDLVALLTKSWGEGAGLADSGPLHPTVFIVGDRKQSIYAFRDAEVSMLREAARHLEGLRPEGDVRRSISRSFRSVPQLLAFVNDLCQDIEKAAARSDAFQYEEEDRFPVEDEVRLKADTTDALAILTGDTPEACAETTAAEIARLIAGGALVRDRTTGIRRPIRPGDVAILFRTRESHREFEAALERHGLPSYVYKGLGFFDADEIKDVLALLWYLADPLSNLRAAAWLRSRFVRVSDEGLRRMSPSLADALSSPEPPAVLAQLDADDADALSAARTSSRRWRALVDRLPPAELLDCVLEESAYLVEIRGPRFLQARENLKKIRAMIRRIQNRGYATLDRIASHLDRLAVGDDANAAIDASDAVSLMTIHAAKGLEFPVVFVVNLARGTANRRAPIRVATSGDEDGSVAVGDFQSSGDEDQANKEREETKRLLYVAVTRARDRLYLGTVLKDGLVQPGRGSLAEVLPASLIARFAEAGGHAASEDDVVTWPSASGGSHAIRVCAAAPAPAAPDSPGRSMLTVSTETDFTRLDDAVAPRQTVASAIGDAGREETNLVEAGLQTLRPDDTRLDESDRLVGSLVHRLLHREGLAADVSDAWIAERLASLVRVEESITMVDRQAVMRRATAAYRAFTTHRELRALYQSGTAYHEVPFSLLVDDRIVRGTIDCLVRTPDGEIAVLEFKTGGRRPEHDAQTAVYQQAAVSLFPGSRVVTQLLYAADVGRS
jgi:ATP-dependent helicase/nuclease subunit A